jgi:hypothetical protein
MIFLEMHQVRRDQNFESENRVNLILSNPAAVKSLTLSSPA